jgi:hypothetical protein
VADDIVADDEISLLAEGFKSVERLIKAAAVVPDGCIISHGSKIEDTRRLRINFEIDRYATRKEQRGVKNQVFLSQLSSSERQWTGRGARRQPYAGTGWITVNSHCSPPDYWNGQYLAQT